MSLNIESHEIRRLAMELASLSGDNGCVTGESLRC